MKITILLIAGICLAAARARAEGDGFEYVGFSGLQAPAAPAAAVMGPVSDSNWHIRSIAYDSRVPFVGKVDIRAGYYAESPEVPFRGDILYLEGLGDSMLNHAPLFSTLSRAGWRVIAFDYMGQGGSGGTMNHTRVDDPALPSLRIAAIADIVWNEFKRDDSPAGARKIVMGWSTGGLAAYEMARRGDADAVVLIAPGIAPRLIVGDKMKITLPTLTSADYSRGNDPHVDAIRPDSPAKAPLFAVNLLYSAGQARHWTIPATVKGLLLLSGPADAYVDAEKTRAVVTANAPQFEVVSFPKSRHEIDNEVPEIREALTAEIIGFLAHL